MKPKRLLHGYARGLGVLVRSVVIAALWEMFILLPLLPFIVVFPDHMEGKAEGSVYVRVAAVLILLVWAPLAAWKFGGLDWLREQTGEDGDTVSSPEAADRVLDPSTGLVTEVNTEHEPDAQPPDGSAAARDAQGREE